MKHLALILTILSLPALGVSVFGGIKEETTLSSLMVGSIQLAGEEAEVTLFTPCHPPFPPGPGPIPIEPPHGGTLRHDCGKKLTLVFDLTVTGDRTQYELLLHSQRVSVTLKNGEITQLRSLRCPVGGCHTDGVSPSLPAY